MKKINFSKAIGLFLMRPALIGVILFVAGLCGAPSTFEPKCRVVLVGRLF